MESVRARHGEREAETESKKTTSPTTGDKYLANGDITNEVFSIATAESFFSLPARASQPENVFRSTARNRTKAEIEIIEREDIHIR